MIFVSLGSQQFQFDRLLVELDRLKEENKIDEEIVAQIGFSDFDTKNFKVIKFLDIDEYKSYMKQCDFLITHAGTGAIVSALKNNKKIIACPRLKKYGEHVDDHQREIAKKYEEQGLLVCCDDMKLLDRTIQNIGSIKFNRFVSNNDKFIEGLTEIVNRL